MVALSDTTGPGVGPDNLQGPSLNPIQLDSMARSSLLSTRFFDSSTMIFSSSSTSVLACRIIDLDGEKCLSIACNTPNATSSCRGRQGGGGAGGGTVREGQKAGAAVAAAKKLALCGGGGG